MTGGGLQWTSDTRDGATIVVPSGRVDESTAGDFRDRLGEAAEAASGPLVVDLVEIAYISSLGLRALTLAQRRRGDGAPPIVLARPNDTMREILAISRYDMVFKVVDTIEDALDK